MRKTRTLIIIMVIMSLLLSCCLVGCSKETAQETSDAVHTIKDMAGREVEVPTKIDKVFSTNPPGAILLYTLDPDLMIGWNYNLGEVDKRFILPQCQNLPNLGGWMAKGTCNTEELLKIKPDLIIYMGDTDQVAAHLANNIQEEVDIPVVVVDSDIKNMDKTYEFIGKLLHQEEQAKILGTYCRETLSEIQSKSKKIPVDKKVRVYYAEGDDGLQTDPSGSRHTEVLDLVGGYNVADITDKGNRGLTQVSLEQVLSWDPDLILSWSNCYENIKADPKWETIKAIQDNKVYTIPSSPFNWFDRPPSVNRVLGLKWLGHLLYPEVYDYDIAEEVREFYKKFYHYDLTDEDIIFLLKDAGGK